MALLYATSLITSILNFILEMKLIPLEFNTCN